MQDEPLALRIVEAVVGACAPRGVPVTLKMRSGWCASVRNALSLARGAQAAGVAMVAVHGRTREQGYGGAAEHDTVAAVKARCTSRWWPTGTSIRRRGPPLSCARLAPTLS
jgi:tRNA-dihydrouridine synthase B